MNQVAEKPKTEVVSCPRIMRRWFNSQGGDGFIYRNLTYTTLKKIQLVYVAIVESLCFYVSENLFSVI